MTGKYEPNSYKSLPSVTIRPLCIVNSSWGIVLSLLKFIICPLRPKKPFNAPQNADENQEIRL